MTPEFLKPFLGWNSADEVLILKRISCVRCHQIFIRKHILSMEIAKHAKID